MWKLECALIAILQSYKLCRLDYVQLEDKIGYIKSSYQWATQLLFDCYSAVG